MGPRQGMGLRLRGLFLRTLSRCQVRFRVRLLSEWLKGLIGEQRLVVGEDCKEIEEDMDVALVRVEFRA
jgi:hypothetical protein